MRKMKIYLVMTTKLAYSLFLQAKDGVTPMVNDNLGDKCHVNLEDAIAASVDISDSLDEPAERGAAVVHIEYDHALHEALAFQGQIKQTGETDFLGKPVWIVTPEGAAALNRQASFTMSIHALPATIKSRPHQSTTTH